MEKNPVPGQSRYLWLSGKGFTFVGQLAYQYQYIFLILILGFGIVLAKNKNICEGHNEERKYSIGQTKRENFEVAVPKYDTCPAASIDRPNERQNECKFSLKLKENDTDVLNMAWQFTFFPATDSNLFATFEFFNIIYNKYNEKFFFDPPGNTIIDVIIPILDGTTTMTSLILPLKKEANNFHGHIMVRLLSMVFRCNMMPPVFAVRVGEPVTIRVSTNEKNQASTGQKKKPSQLPCTFSVLLLSGGKANYLETKLDDFDQGTDPTLVETSAKFTLWPQRNVKSIGSYNVQADKIVHCHGPYQHFTIVTFSLPVPINSCDVNLYFKLSDVTAGIGSDAPGQGTSSASATSIVTSAPEKKTGSDAPGQGTSIATLTDISAPGEEKTGRYNDGTGSRGDSSGGRGGSSGGRGRGRGDSSGHSDGSASNVEDGYRQNAFPPKDQGEEIEICTTTTEEVTMCNSERVFTLTPQSHTQINCTVKIKIEEFSPNNVLLKLLPPGDGTHVSVQLNKELFDVEDSVIRLLENQTQTINLQVRFVNNAADNKGGKLSVQLLLLECNKPTPVIPLTKESTLSFHIDQPPVLPVTGCYEVEFSLKRNNLKSFNELKVQVAKTHENNNSDHTSVTFLLKARYYFQSKEGASYQIKFTNPMVKMLPSAEGLVDKITLHLQDIYNTNGPFDVTVRAWMSTIKMSVPTRKIYFGMPAAIYGVSEPVAKANRKRRILYGYYQGVGKEPDRK